MDGALHFIISMFIAGLLMGFARRGRLAPVPAFIFAFSIVFSIGLVKECLDPVFSYDDMFNNIVGALFGTVFK